MNFRLNQRRTKAGFYRINLRELSVNSLIKFVLVVVIVGKGTTNLATGQVQMLAVHFINIPMVGQAIKGNFDHLRFRTGQHRHSIRRNVDMRIAGGEHMHCLGLKIFRLFRSGQNTKLIIEDTGKRNKSEAPAVADSSFSTSVGFDRQRRLDLVRILTFPSKPGFKGR